MDRGNYPELNQWCKILHRQIYSWQSKDLVTLRRSMLILSPAEVLSCHDCQDKCLWQVCLTIRLKTTFRHVGFEGWMTLRLGYSFWWSPFPREFLLSYCLFSAYFVSLDKIWEWSMVSLTLRGLKKGLADPLRACCTPNNKCDT